MTEAQKMQWEKLGVPDVESLIEKGYRYCVQFSENEKPFGDPLCFKTSDDISSFMQSYPSMKMVWQRKLLEDIPNILKVGDSVLWRGSWGTSDPKLVTVTCISIGSKNEDNPVETIEWSKVDEGVIVDLDNGHWAHGDQISKK